MNSNILIITGMHRSGTSVVTQWLNRCGLPIGKKLVPPGIGNAEGHFEDADFLEIHEHFLKSRNLPVSGFTNKPLLSLNSSDKQQLQALIASKQSENDQWGWKEPRTCLFLDIYKELLPSAFYLVVVRDYNSTINSMLSREYKTQKRKYRTKKGLSKLKWFLFKRKSREEVYRKYADSYLKVWIYYYECILDHIVSLPIDQYMFVQYAGLLDQDENVFTRLKDQWKFLLYYFPFKDVFKKNLLSEPQNIDGYVKDKRLIERAKKIDRLVARLLES